MLLNKTASFALGFLKRRLLNIHNDSYETQRGVLLDICKCLRGTKYAADHIGVDSKLTYEDFDALPIVHYADISEYIEKMKGGKKDMLVRGLVNKYGESSGTTSHCKLIPITQRYARKNLLGGALYSASIITSYNQYALDGKLLTLSGNVNEHNGNIIGDVSAIMVDGVPDFLRTQYGLSGDFNNMDWDSKVEYINSIIQESDIRGFGGLPTWNIKLLRRLIELNNIETISEICPNVSYFVHGGVNILPYKDELISLFGKSEDEFQFYNVYNATEGVFAMQDDIGDDGMLLLLDCDVYFEFIKLDDYYCGKYENIINLSSVELDQPYVMVISNTSGLYRYIIGDVVSFTCLSPFKITLLGRTKGFLNTFGEEVMENSCDEIIASVSSHYNITISDYVVSPRVNVDGVLGRHEWVIELRNELDLQKTEALSDLIDLKMKELSHDYGEKRKSNLIMSKPIVYTVGPGTFDRIIAKNNKRGVQSKVSRIQSDTEFLDTILSNV